MAQLVLAERFNAQQHIRIPLTSSLDPQGLNLIKRECGFPDDWTYIDISVWLANYDYIPITRRQMPRNDINNDALNIGHYIGTNYNVRENFWNQADIIWLNMPLVAFDPRCTLRIGQLIVGEDFNIQNYEHWVRYLLLGGPDRIRIGVRRYDPNIQINQMFENMDVNDNQYA